jgi:D-beta-D-heptose 7-phosphate kinase/D-beta-D-heptose 1-phosphate adenosyltransferase
VERVLEGPESLDLWLAWRRLQGRRVVFTNGCFDLLHAGHLSLLHAARAQGDALLVGLNSDASVARLKGAGRPVVPWRERAAVLAGLGCVDGVVGFDEDTPLALIRAVRPDVLVKGADYTLDQVVGRAEVEAAGGEVVLVPVIPGASTTSTLARVRASP